MLPVGFGISGQGEEGYVLESQKRLSKISEKIQLVDDSESISGSYRDFIECSNEDLILKKLSLAEKQKEARKSDKQEIRERMREIFNIPMGDEPALEINPYKKAEAAKRKEKEEMKDFVDPVKAALTNNIELKNYTLKADLRTKRSYAVENIAEYVADDLAVHSLLANNSLNTSVANLDSSVQLAEMSKARSVEFAILNNYHDLIAIDPEEKNSESFRTIYISHIMNHLSKVPVRKHATEIDEDEEDEEAAVEGEDDEKLKNCGFTNCKVVIIAPFKVVLQRSIFRGGGVML